MNKPTPNITEEHIVAWLDGEMPSAPGFENSAKADHELATAASEYAALDAAFAATRGDNRFALPKAVDSRVRATLAREISRGRKTVRMPEPAPLAAPMPSTTTVVRTKSLWVRRSAYAMALVVMAIFGWFIGHTGQTNTETATIAPSTTPNQIVTAPTASPVADNSNSASAVNPTVEHTANVSASHPAPLSNTQTHVSASVTTPATAVATNPVTPTQNPPAASEENDPAAIMASHRYAKLVKTTPAVVITAQDQL